MRPESPARGFQEPSKYSARIPVSGWKNRPSHHVIELSRPGKKHCAAGGFVPCKHGLEEMHVRVLLAPACVGRQNAVVASGGRREVLIEDTATS